MARTRTDGPTAREIGGMIDTVTAAGLKKFLTAELLRDPDMLGRFSSVAAKGLKKKRQVDYREAAQKLINRAMGQRGYIDHNSAYVSFAGVVKDARASERIGDHTEAARIYAGIYEAITDSFNSICSVEGRFMAQASRCVVQIGACAKAARSAGGRREILSRLLRMWLADADGLYHSAFQGALHEGLAEPGDARHLTGLLIGGMEGAGGMNMWRGESGERSLKRQRRRLRGTLAKHARGGCGCGWEE